MTSCSGKTKHGSLDEHWRVGYDVMQWVNKTCQPGATLEGCMIRHAVGKQNLAAVYSTGWGVHLEETSEFLWMFRAVFPILPLCI